MRNPDIKYLWFWLKVQALTDDGIISKFISFEMINFIYTLLLCLSILGVIALKPFFVQADLEWLFWTVVFCIYYVIIRKIRLMGRS